MHISTASKVKKNDEIEKIDIDFLHRIKNKNKI